MLWRMSWARLRPSHCSPLPRRPCGANRDLNQRQALRPRSRNPRRRIGTTWPPIWASKFRRHPPRRHRLVVLSRNQWPRRPANAHLHHRAAQVRRLLRKDRNGRSGPNAQNDRRAANDLSAKIGLNAQRDPSGRSGRNARSDPSVRSARRAASKKWTKRRHGNANPRHSPRPPTQRLRRAAPA
jgi:hypothetical protein